MTRQLVAVAKPGSASGVLQGLRWWASGFGPDEAAVELLAAVAVAVPAVLDPEAGFAGAPWLVRCTRPGWWCLDGAALSAARDWFPAGVRAVVRLIGLLDRPGVDLSRHLAAVPAVWWGPALTAVDHASGCHALQLVTSGGNDQPALFPDSRAVGAVGSFGVVGSGRVIAIPRLDGAA